MRMGTKTHTHTQTHPDDGGEVPAARQRPLVDVGVVVLQI